MFLFIFTLLHIPFYTMVCATSCICGTHSLMWKTRDQRTDWFSFTISCKGSCLHSAHYNVLLLLNVLKINVDNEVFGFLKAFHICALHCQIWTQELLSFPPTFFCSNHVFHLVKFIKCLLQLCALEKIELLISCHSEIDFSLCC